MLLWLHMITILFHARSSFENLEPPVEVGYSQIDVQDVPSYLHVHTTLYVRVNQPVLRPCPMSADHMRDHARGGRGVSGVGGG